MKFRTIIFVLSIILFLTSCGESEIDYIFQSDRFANLRELKISKAVAFEIEKGSIEQTYDNTFGLGKDYYPNKLNYQLANPRIWERVESNLHLETDYFYDKSDSLVKVILYQWNSKNDTLRLDDENQTFQKIFKNRYNEIAGKLNKKLGSGSEVKNLPHSTSFQYAKEWTTRNLKVYLSMHGYLNNNEIRLIIYHN